MENFMSESLLEINFKIKKVFQVLQEKAVPNDMKAYQLYKFLQQEGFINTYPVFKINLTEYYKTPRAKRTSQVFEAIFKIIPYSWLENQFHLDFYNGCFSETEVFKVATSIHSNLIIELSLPAEITDLSLLHLVVFKLTRPSYYQEKSNLDFSSFLATWADVSFQRFGDKYNPEFNQLEIMMVDLESSISTGAEVIANNVQQTASTMSMTQTDLDWLNDIFLNLSFNEIPPQYPLSRGPRLPKLCNLDKTIRQFRWNAKNKRFKNSLEMANAVLEIKSLCEIVQQTQVSTLAC